jgi:hypothetical protein
MKQIRILLILLLSIFLGSSSLGATYADSSNATSGQVALASANKLIDTWNLNMNSADAFDQKNRDALDKKLFEMLQSLKSEQASITSKFTDDYLTLTSAIASNEAFCLSVASEFGISLTSGISCVSQLANAYPAAYKQNPKIGELTSNFAICLEVNDALNAAQDAMKNANDSLAFAAKSLSNLKAAADKAAADAITAQKAAAAAKASALKKTAITCIKGKLTKTVVAVKPVCPAGYKIKK